MFQTHNRTDLYYVSDYFVKRIYNQNNRLVYYGDSSGHWRKYEYDSNDKEIYFESSSGVIRDKRNV